MYERASSGVIVRDNQDGTTAYIPPDETNLDYRAYLTWVAEGNEATARPEPVPVVVPDPDAELDAAITAATTFAQLKAALLAGGGRVKARPRA